MAVFKTVPSLEIPGVRGELLEGLQASREKLK